MGRLPWVVRAPTETDRELLARLLRGRWSGPTVVVHDRVYEPSTLPALLAEQDGAIVGLLTYVVENDELEVVTLDSLQPGRGVGAALMGAAIETARNLGCRRLWLITTNDNTDALRWYQRLGFRLAALDCGAVDRARKLKPAIPIRGAHDIALHDELELELVLRAGPP